MKKILLSTLFAMLTASGIQAEEYPYLTFETTGGEVKSISVSSMTLTVSGDNLVVANNEGTQATYALSELSKMYFTTAETTGIEGVKADASAVEALNGEVEIFNQAGMNLGKFTSMASAIPTLKSGVYIVKSNNGTLKVSVK